MANAYTTINSLTRHARRISRRVIFSYALDWLMMVAIFGMAGGFHYIDAQGSRHAFSLQDPNISFPLTQDTVSNPVLYVASVVLPAVIIAAICVVIIPHGRPSSERSSPTRTRRRLWQRKLWELHSGWLGLALSALGSIAITNGLKALAGKPRPHLLAVCDPDLSPDAIARWRVGGLGGGIDGTDGITALSTAPILVTWQICRNTNEDEMKNAFSSWPSGHATTSWSGLLYLTLWFCAKFGVAFPMPGLSWPLFNSGDKHIPTNESSPDMEITGTTAAESNSHSHVGNRWYVRNQGAAPPAYLVLLAVVPIGAAFFISISRWYDYRHHGFDIVSGVVIGSFCAWISFHLYQTPIVVGDGWAWAPRERGFAFGTLVGRRRGGGIRCDGFSTTVDEDTVRMGKAKGNNEVDVTMKSQSGSGSGSGTVSREGPEGDVEMQTYAR